MREPFLRLVVGSGLPARILVPGLPRLPELPARTGELTLEIVTHCWNYAHLLVFQLSSLVNFPPSGVDVRVTVFHAPEDARTVELVRWFSRYDLPRVTWNWVPIERTRLMRRAIGRNQAALGTDADWIWFTDCDVVFGEGCLDGLAAALQGRTDPLVHPRFERITPLLSCDDPMLRPGAGRPGLVEIDPSRFVLRELDRATGPMQVTHGDAARMLGYCDALPYYQRPADHWRKATEDRAFRWLLGTQGHALEVPEVYRIRHAHKGRYREGSFVGGVRGGVRRIQSRIRGEAGVEREGAR